MTETSGAIRRPHVVWGTLVLAMTVVGGVLLLSESSHHRPAPPPALASVPPQTHNIEDIFSLSVPVRSEGEGETPWLGVVIHHSASTSGSHDSLDELHRQQGLNGLGYHFVIGNGRGAPDGRITVGRRWQQQDVGAHTIGPNADHYNTNYIGICLIGDGDRRPFTVGQLSSLATLVGALREELGLRPDHIVLHREVAQTASPGRLFPRAWLASELEQGAGDPR